MANALGRRVTETDKVSACVVVNTWLRIYLQVCSGHFLLKHNAN